MADFTRKQKIIRAICIRPLTAEEVVRAFPGLSETLAQTILGSLVETGMLKVKTFSPYPSTTVTQYRSTGKGRYSVALSDRHRAQHLTAQN